MVSLADATFMAMAVLAVGGAVMALEAREIVYGAIGLAVSFFGVAALFFLLDSPFVAVFQLTIYIGAVAVLILFTVMLVREGKWMRDNLSTRGQIAGALTAIALAASLALAFAASSFADAVKSQSAPGFESIGKLITGQFAPALEVLALVLAASVLGAMMLAKMDREETT